MLELKAKKLDTTKSTDSYTTLANIFSKAVEMDDSVVLFQRCVTAGIIQQIAGRKFCVGLNLVHKADENRTVLESSDRLAIGRLQTRKFLIGETYEDGTEDAVQSLARFNSVQLVLEPTNDKADQLTLL
jgi:hypothetical protein